MRALWNEPSKGERYARALVFPHALTDQYDRGWLIVEWDGKKWQRKLAIWCEEGSWTIEDDTTTWTAGCEDGAVTSALDGTHVLLPHFWRCSCRQCSWDREDGLI